MKKRTMILALLLCVSLCGCRKEKQERPIPSRSTDPINQIEVTTPSDTGYHTAVYVTVFGDTAYLATYPREVGDDGEEMACGIREISKGGTILCGGEHEKEIPITRVVILDQIHPDSTAEWFRNMTTLRRVSGLSNLKMENVTDMSYMFSGCTRLAELEADHWDVSKVTSMTGIFDGCDALPQKPSWYQE